ncbi:MAG: ADP-forming succinate--CoA ligase subunit beta [Vampirovibrionia bacterium]
MKVHEYQAKEIFKEFGVPVPKGNVAKNVEEAVAVSKELGYNCVLKAQIHAGGRGKGGGVKLAHSEEEVKNYAKDLIGMNLITHQTGPEGKKVKTILIEELKGIAKELYLGIVIDRATASPVIMASTEGGMDIEKVAAETPELIIKEFINPMMGLQRFQVQNIVNKLNIPAEAQKEAISLISNLYKVFIEKDCSLAEVNPLVITTDNRVLALDAKLNFDDGALYRQKDIIELRDLDEEDPLEVEASKYGLNYIKLDGNVGCMVNGAGLAMATMDIIKLAGGSPANFLDVGGGATTEAIENAFRILLMDKNVKAVLINIFGGILRCDNLAKGVVEATKKTNINLPIIIRLEGTNVEEGKRILENSDLEFSVASSMAEAANLVTKAVG